jgi:3-dehydroquinate dehydratase type I
MFKVIPFQKSNVKNIKDADIFEIWFDRIDSKHYPEIFKKIKKPIIYKIEKINNKNLKNLKKNIIKKSKYIDIDLNASVKAEKDLIKKIKKINPKIKVIISYHNFKETPYEKDLKKIYRKMLSQKADIVKFATQAKKISDSFRMLDFLSSLNGKKQKAICLCMGNEGLLTRISGHLFGNYLMYFSMDEKSKTAEGQITIKKFKKFTNES